MILEKKDLKSPKGHLILGHLPQFKTTNKHQVIERWIEECGELFKINFIRKEFIVSANPELNDKILRLRPDKFRRFSKIDEIFREMGIVGVFNAEGDTWKRHRKPTSEALNVQNIKSFFPAIQHKTNKLLEKLNSFADKKSVDIQKEFMSFTIDVTTSIVFGYEIDTINNKSNEFQRALELIFPTINERITAPIPIWRFYKRKKDKQVIKALKSIEKVIYTFIDDAKLHFEKQPELKANPSNFLEALLIEKEGMIFSDEEVYGNLFSMLLAGEDTTSNSMSWAMYYLAQNPDVVEKIRTEAKNVYGLSNTPTSNEQLAKLQYTKAVAMEAIRLKPTTPQLYLEANEQVIVDHLKIDKGVKMILQCKSAQNNESYFSEATLFSPERWLKSECPIHKKHTPNTMKAFGGGSRFCPGMALAINEMTIVLSTLAKNFNFELAVEPSQIEEHFAFTMYPKNLFINFYKVD